MYYCWLWHSHYGKHSILLLAISKEFRSALLLYCIISCLKERAFHTIHFQPKWLKGDKSHSSLPSCFILADSHSHHHHCPRSSLSLLQHHRPSVAAHIPAWGLWHSPYLSAAPLTEGSSQADHRRHSHREEQSSGTSRSWPTLQQSHNTSHIMNTHSS